MRQGEAPPAVVTFPPPPQQQAAAIENRWPAWTTASSPSMWSKPTLADGGSVIENRWPEAGRASAFARASTTWGPFKKD